MGKTKIEWADRTWNPYTWSCNRVSPGCKNCYMMTLAARFGNGTDKPEWRGEKARREFNRLKAGDVVFVNSMSDTYHESVPNRWIHWIHNMIASRPGVIFLVLTKRPHRARGLSPHLQWPKNLWIGTSLEGESYTTGAGNKIDLTHRLDDLLRIPATGHFLSAEPLLAPLPNLSRWLTATPKRAGLGWVIAGGESGKHRRPMDLKWVRDIRDACLSHETPFLYKQGVAFKSGQRRYLDGRTWDETPFAPRPDVTAYADLPLFDGLGA